MIRTLTYRFPLGGMDGGVAQERVKALAQARARRNKSLYEVLVSVVDDDSLLVNITVDGHSLWRANGIARIEAEAIARTLRVMGTLESDTTEPTMRNLTVEQGRAQSYENRSRTVRHNRAEHLKRFRERLNGS